MQGSRRANLLCIISHIHTYLIQTHIRMQHHHKHTHTNIRTYVLPATSKRSKFDWPLDGVVQGSLNVKYLLSLSRLEHYAAHLRDSGEPLVVPTEWEQAEDVGCRASKVTSGVDVNQDVVLIHAETEGKGAFGSKALDSHVAQGVKALYAEARGKAGGGAIRALVAAGVPVDGVQKQVNTYFNLHACMYGTGGPALSALIASVSRFMSIDAPMHFEVSVCIVYFLSKAQADCAIWYVCACVCVCV
jgi:hypothetical protein